MCKGNRTCVFSRSLKARCLVNDNMITLSRIKTSMNRLSCLLLRKPEVKGSLNPITIKSTAKLTNQVPTDPSFPFPLFQKFRLNNLEFARVF